jgi:hypothetical protein
VGEVAEEDQGREVGGRYKMTVWRSPWSGRVGGREVSWLCAYNQSFIWFLTLGVAEQCKLKFIFAPSLHHFYCIVNTLLGR